MDGMPFLFLCATSSGNDDLTLAWVFRLERSGEPLTPWLLAETKRGQTLRFPVSSDRRDEPRNYWNGARQPEDQRQTPTAGLDR